jgi:hypothetical protein
VLLFQLFNILVLYTIDVTYAGNNIADEIANLDPILETHEFVQKIEKSKGSTGQIPAIILHSENQMKEEFKMSQL